MDPALELRNFEAAGNTLAEVFSDLEIDSCPVLAEYINPDTGFPDLPTPETADWYSVHVRESQYLLQVSYVISFVNR